MNQELGVSPNTESAGALTLDLLASRNINSKFLLFVSYLVCGILLLQPKWNKTNLFPGCVNLRGGENRGNHTKNVLLSAVG